ncbi:MAG: putative porin, partial [Planctomycetota bacterium]
MKTSKFGWVLLVLALTVWWGGGPAGAEDSAVVEEILQVLKDRGIVDEDEYQRLAAKNAKYEAEKNSWMPKIDWSGDFRFRHGSWWYEKDETGNELGDRYRIRYRFRLQGVLDVNEYSDVVFKLVSGGNDSRTSNKTLGSLVDFDTDDIRLKLAYARMTAPSSWVPFPDGKAVLQMGKVPIPFVWKVQGMSKGKDFMLWDADIAPEGVSLLLNSRPSEWSRLFATFGYYIDDENGQDRDPHFWGLQAGGHQQLSEDVTVGARASWYEFRSIDAAFNARAAFGFDDDGEGPASGAGNILDGLNGDIDGNPFSVVETGAYLTYGGFEAWPITVYGTYARNLD